METIDKLATLLREARASCKGLILSARQRDEKIALYLIAHGVEIPVRCGVCGFARFCDDGRIRCTHPNRRNPDGCWETEYCDAGVREDGDE